MALLDILVYPDPRLRQVAEPVVKFDAELKTLVENMRETMYEARGMGLAAVQVNVPLRVVVMDLSEDKTGFQVFINPTITQLDASILFEEGCLSVPGFYSEIERVENVIIQAQDLTGNSFEIKADGLLSICIQHEIDHLDGKVFVDYLSKMKQDRVKKKMKKETRHSQNQAAW